LLLRRCWRKSHQEEHSAGHGGKSQPNGRGVCEDIGQVKISPRGCIGIPSFFEKTRKRTQAPGAWRLKKLLGVGACARRIGCSRCGLASDRGHVR